MVLDGDGQSVCPLGGTVTGSTGSSDGASPTLFRVLARRTAIAVVVVLIWCVPFAVLAVISGQLAASSWATMGSYCAMTNLMIGGRATAYLTVGLLTALTPVAIVSGAVPVSGAALMAIMCLGVGLSSARGLQRGLLLIPIMMAFLLIAPPPWSGGGAERTTTSYLLWNTLFWGVGGLWGVLVFPPFLRKLKMPFPHPDEPWARADTAVYTITITVLCTASTLVALIVWPGSNGAWLVVTVLAVTAYGATNLKRTFHRIAGTVVGVVIAGIVASLSGSEAVLLAIGLVLLVITLVIMLGPHPYFLYAVFLTPAVVLFTATSIADVHKTDAQRLVFTLIGAALVLLASGIALGWAHYQQTHVIDPGSPEAEVQPAT